jgi:phosphoribosylaminoimidazole (AIR) synthetase
MGQLGAHAVLVALDDQLAVLGTDGVGTALDIDVLLLSGRRACRNARAVMDRTEA